MDEVYARYKQNFSVYVHHSRDNFDFEIDNL